MGQRTPGVSPFPDDDYRTTTIAALERAMHAEQRLAAFQSSRTFAVIAAGSRMVSRIAPTGTWRRRALACTARLLQRSVRTVERHLVGAFSAPRRFHTAATPVVSIVIPVYGNWPVTRACLTALTKTTCDVPLQIIVVDDKSPDRSLRKLRRLRGLTVVALDQNRGYVGATNAGIQAAAGEFVVLLNNDTRVSPDWLGPLLERIQEPGVGLVGAKLLYPHGALQDAGGIVFTDGSAWNYGKHNDPLSHEYMYARDADYVSGACTIIRKSTLDQLGGGLDERFAPAYYDDTDLAFAVRESGLRVVFEPRSIVIHDEGVSHGTDETQGVKQFQVVNHAKFVEKWHKVLESHPERDPEIVPWAARRHQGKGIVAVIDDMIPRPDLDSGSVRRVAFLRGLRDLGYAVIFDAVSPERPTPYVEALTSLGIEVLDSTCDLVSELQAMDDHVTAVVVARAPVAVSRLFDVRKVIPNVPVVFDTVDLHYLREQRAREVDGGDPDAREVAYLKDVEHAIAATSDLTVVVSEVERELLAKDMPDITVTVVSNVHSMPPEPAPVAGRKGLLFVGSFAHLPNVDAVEWYLDEIHPLVRNQVPDCEVTFVGFGAPEELVARAPDGVRLVGWVEDLAPLYDQSRIAIAPLRYGAGVKGKVGEALSYGLPTVMTPIGAEGMGLSHRETAFIADNAIGFAQGIAELCSDDELWTRMSSAGREHIDSHFGPRRFRADLNTMMAMVSAP